MKRLPLRHRGVERRRPCLRFESLETRQVLSGTPLISEFMASNSDALLDEDGDSSDWIEIYNPTDAAIDLDGWHLTDDLTELDKWEFQSVMIEPGGYLVVFASGKDRDDPEGEQHTNFRLGADGESLALVEPNGLSIADQYGPDYPEQRTDVSYGIGQSPEVLLARGSDASWFVPTSPSLGDSWLESGFDDADWNSGPTSVGYGISRLGFEVRDVKANVSSFGQVLNLFDADDLLSRSSDDPQVASDTTGVVPVVNFYDNGGGGGDGNFGSNSPFPNDEGGDDD
ncbi:MAG: lamin tail domain-containing protein, partial [Planctomycetota bacterium]